METLTFIDNIKRVKDSRNYKVTGSLGVYDAYKHIRKNGWLHLERPLTEHEFYSIIRRVNSYLADNLANGEDVDLPCRFGRLEVRKYPSYVTILDGKIKTNLPIDWDRTLKLWAEDLESYENKILVRLEDKYLIKVYYNRNKAEYNNKSFYQFEVNRELKKRIRLNFKNRKYDTFLF